MTAKILILSLTLIALCLIEADAQESLPGVGSENNSTAVITNTVFDPIDGNSTTTKTTTTSIVEVTKAPDVLKTHVPEVTKVHVPEVAKTHLPEVDKTHLPEVPKTHLPDVAKTHIPDVVKAHVPEVAKTHLPDVIKPHTATDVPTVHLTENHVTNHTAPVVHKISEVHVENRTVDAHVHKEPDVRFGEYMKPICEALPKLSPKQLFRVQSQLKQFVEMTNGKLAVCFMEHYSLNPTLKVLAREDIQTICSSRLKDEPSVGSFKAFVSCAKANWCKTLDKELDRICEIRKSNLKKHAHMQTSMGTNQTVNNHQNNTEHHHTTILHDDEDPEGVAMVNDVVSKVLDVGKMNNTDVKVIDAALTHSTTMKPLLDVSNKTKIETNHTLKASTDDPNTVLVLVDESKTTAAPKSTVVKAEIEKPLNSTKFTNGTVIETFKVVSTSKPLVLEETKLSTNKSIVEKLPKLTTLAPTTTSKPSNKTTIVIKSTVTPIKPLDTLESIVERQEKEKRVLEAKFKQEREKVIKDLSKDETDSHNAIKSLQAQRQTASMAHSIPDTRLHQLEHERQMMIDPVGHTIKHQQYEMNKQRALGRPF